MSNLKRTLAKDLLFLLKQGYNVKKIASWADSLYWKNIGQNIPDLESIAFMDAGPEFVLGEEALCRIAQKWLEEGDKEDLAVTVAEIKERAEDIGQGWSYCPVCHDAWKNTSSHAMVKCPSCDSMLHNPNYVQGE